MREGQGSANDGRFHFVCEARIDGLRVGVNPLEERMRRVLKARVIEGQCEGQLGRQTRARERCRLEVGAVAWVLPREGEVIDEVSGIGVFGRVKDGGDEEGLTIDASKVTLVPTKEG